VEDCPIFQSKVTGVGIRLDSEVLWRKDGTSFPAEYSSSPIFDQGIIRGVVVTFSDITERKRLEEELQHQATTDELTGEINRRHFLSLAFGELTRAIRLEHPLSIALIDIDHFKSINDTYGHAVGDQALIVFSKICRQNIREIDVFARFGGDEFALLLPETSREQAFMTIERVRLVLADQPFVLAGKPVSITISSGIASLSSDQETFDVLLSRADQALYQAKEAGRNCVVQGQ
jgi:diguanylate cyclase (GGDEF)-like protein